MPTLRLLHTTNLHYKVFGSFNNEKTKPPDYAILSHVWLKNWDGHREIVFSDMEQIAPNERSQLSSFRALDRYGDRGDPASSHAKIMNACKQAASNGMDWIWIDSCCINKQDIAETNEAINSMFTWYSKASLCFVYLSDVQDDKLPPKNRGLEWFTRGWTLQELLSSSWKNTKFFNTDWNLLGTKASLCSEIGARTGIARRYLSNYETACAAVKLSWAADRETSLVEDRAYSLLGLFDVQMDIRYGAHAEEHAFRWLQEAIVNQTQDESIFAWTHPSLVAHGMLAPTIECFRNCGNLTIYSSKRKPRPRNAYSMSKGALSFHVPMDPRPVASLFAILQSPLPAPIFEPAEFVRMQKSRRRDCLLTLNCWRLHVEDENDTVCIKLSRDERSEIWQRVDCDRLEWTNRVKAVSERFRVNRVDELIIADVNLKDTQFVRIPRSVKE